MIITDDPGLEGMVERAMLFRQLCEVSKLTPIRFEDGLIEVRGTRLGTRGIDITNDLLLEAIKKGYGG